MTTDFEIANEMLFVREDGKLAWRVTRKGHVQKNRLAGGQNRLGYMCVRFCGKCYLAHRVVWLLTHGEWPDGQIDHINQNKTDNRPANLRVVTSQVNNQNKMLSIVNSKTGLLGVAEYKGKYRASAVNPTTRKTVYLGLFKTIEEAFTVSTNYRNDHYLGRSPHYRKQLATQIANFNQDKLADMIYFRHEVAA